MSISLYSARVLQLDTAERRVRFRVFLARYDRSWGREGLVPDDAGFFLRVLWDAADGVANRRHGPLHDLVSIEECIDPEWADAHSHRFVRAVERLAIRNTPVDDAHADRLSVFYTDHFDSLDAHYHEWDNRWTHEDGLVQADYDVWVTDPRWLAPLRHGQGFVTSAYQSRPGPTGLSAAATGSAYARLGWLRAERGDLDGAAACYRRAADLGDAHTTVEALLSLDELHAGREEAGPGDEPRRRARAALELCVRLRSDGRQEEARAAYLIALEARDPALLAEARRRAGMETPAERGYRLVREGDRAAAAAELRRAYEPSALVVEFGLALFDGDFDAAAAALQRIGGDLEETWLGEVAVDLAFVYARGGDDAATEAVVELLTRNEFAIRAWHYALGNGSAHPLEAVVAIGKRLAASLPPSDYEVYGTRPYAWCQEAYWICVGELGGTEAADAAVLRLGRLLHEIGDTGAARAAYVCVRELGRAGAESRATVGLARLLDETGEDEEAAEAYEAVADHVGAAHEAGGGAAGRTDVRVTSALSRISDGEGTSAELDVLEGELARLHGPRPDGDSRAASLYAQWLAAAGDERRAQALSLKISGQGA
jgi:tetratricopeptide (TPR) repeat protein